MGREEWEGGGWAVGEEGGRERREGQALNPPLLPSPSPFHVT